MDKQISENNGKKSHVIQWVVEPPSVATRPVHSNNHPDISYRHANTMENFA